MLSLMIAAALLQATPAVTDLSYGETYGCAVLARAGYAKMYEGGTSPVTTSEIELATALQTLQTLAEAALPVAQARDGYQDSMLEGAQNAAREGLAGASEDQLGEAMVMCGKIFGIVES